MVSSWRILGGPRASIYAGLYQRDVTECSLHGLSSVPVYPGPALSMTPLADDLIAHVPALFEPADLSQGLGEAVSAAGKTTPDC